MNPKFDHVLNIASFITSILLSFHIIFMIYLYLKRINKRIHYYNEPFENRFKAFFCLYPSSHIYNRIYNLFFLIARALVIVAMVIGEDAFTRYLMIVIGCFFFFNDIAQVKFGWSSKKLSILQILGHFV